MYLTIENHRKVLGKYGNHAIRDIMFDENWYVFEVVELVKSHDGTIVEDYPLDIIISRHLQRDLDGNPVTHIESPDGRRKIISLEWLRSDNNTTDSIINEYKRICA